MLIENGLQSGCVNFPSNGTLCVTGHCQTHLASAEDTCLSLASKYGVTITQLITWNSVLNNLCSNFDIVVGHQICVSYPGNATSQENTYASSKAGGTATQAAPIPTNVVAGTNVNCGKYYQTKGQFSNANFELNCNLLTGVNYRLRLLPGYSYGPGN